MVNGKFNRQEALPMESRVGEEEMLFFKDTCFQTYRPRFEILESVKSPPDYESL
jgi:hypothetical protein